MGKKPDGIPYVDYYISMHLGFCRGPVDRWVGLRVKDKQLFKDEQQYFDSVKISVNEPELFGGNLREGGLVGDVYFMNGEGNSEAPKALANRVGLTPETMPAYRGKTTFFFCGNEDTGTKGFKVGSNMPNVPNIEAELIRNSRQLDNNVPVILSPDDRWRDSNPANIIFECLIRNDLMGGTRDQIDEDVFNEAAYTLADENFGLSLQWNGTGEIEAFIQEVLSHIDALMFFNPYTGKMHLKLMRKDYVREELPGIGPDQCVMDTFRRPLWGETVNEIVVTWTDPRNEKPKSVTYQDNANISMQGQTVSETRDMRGIRNRQLANDVCARELRRASAPLASGMLRVQRSFRKEDGSPFLPGDCFILTYPKYGIVQAIFRILEIDWGTVDKAMVTWKIVEDVWGLDFAKYDDPDDTAWTPPEKDPNEIGVYEYLFRATPASIIRRRAPVPGADRDSYLDDDLYNQIAINTYILPTDEQFDLQHYIAYRPGVNTLGEEEWVSVGEKSVVGHTTLVGSIGQAVKSVITIEPTIGPGTWPKAGFLGMLLGEDEFSDELFTFEERVGEDEEGRAQWRIRRGILDTIPRAWTPGARIIIHANNYNGYDWSPRFADVAERYRFAVRTSLGISEMSNEVTTTRPDRPYRPYRPANVRVGGTMFGAEDQSQKLPDVEEQYPFNLEHVPRQWIIPLQWSRRNRFSEDLSWLAWNDADVPPEPGQTTEIIVRAGAKEIARITGLTGTSYDFDIAQYTYTLTKITLEFISRRPHPDIPEGIVSLQGIKIDLLLYIKGYGSDWDYFWGGWPYTDTLTEIEDADLIGLLPTVAGTVEN